MTPKVADNGNGLCPICRKTFIKTDFNEASLFMRNVLSEITLKVTGENVLFIYRT